MQNAKLLLLSFLLTPLMLSAQFKLDVDGPARIYGTLDLRAPGNSLFIGNNAGAADNGTNNLNVFLGPFSGDSNTNGERNVFVGPFSGSFNTTGDRNIFSGYAAGYHNTTGVNNVFLGYAAGNDNTTGNQNVFLGYSAGFRNTTGGRNVFVGNQTGYSNTTGNQNVFSGHLAGYRNTTGINNVFLGCAAGNDNTTGYDNTILGSFSGWENTEGFRNVFIGKEAGNLNTTGYGNVFSGYRAGYSNTTGDLNVFLGYAAGINSTQGFRNVFVGLSAGNFNTTGSDNVFLGDRAGRDNRTGSDNVFVGDQAGYSNWGGDFRTGLGRSANSIGSYYDNSTGLGHNADPTAGNTVHIGNTSVFSIRGNVNYSTYSDGRFKRKIKRDEVPGLAFIKELQPLTYHVSVDAFADWKEAAYGERDTVEWKGKYDIEQIKFTGFIAQEVEAAADKIGYDFSGVDKPTNEKSIYGLRYAAFVVPLVEGMQEQQVIIEAQQQEMEQQKEVNQSQQDAINSLQSENNELRSRLQRLEGLVGGLLGEEAPQGQATWLSSARLDQNVPNPFNGHTRISYFLPESATGKAEIVITDAQGQEVKRVLLQSRGEGYLEIDTNLLTAGGYQYALLLGGQVIAARQMVRVK